MGSLIGAMQARRWRATMLLVLGGVMAQGGAGCAQAPAAAPDASRAQAPAVLAAAGPLPAASAPPPAPVTRPAATKSPATTERTLSNGLRVIVREDHRAPVAVHVAMYRVGSVDEVSGRTGLAHLLEHLMFKGTSRYPGGEFSRIVAAMGGQENAYTSLDHTAYYQRIPAHGLARVMELEADRMAGLAFAQDEFASELRVVMEERRLRTEDQPGGLLRESLTAQAYMASPVRRPVVGWMSDLESLQLEDARSFYRDWYAPGNATVVVAGDVDPGAVFALAEKTYGAVPDRPLPVRRPQAEPPQRGPRRVAVGAPAETPSLVLAFKAPALREIEGPVDPYALAMLAAVLDADENGRLARELVRERRLANSVGASWDLLGRDPALFRLSAVPAEGVSVEQLEEALREQVARVARDGVAPSDLERIRAQYLAGRIYQRDSIFSQVMEIVGLEAAGLSWADSDRILERIAAVTDADIRAVAGRYFDEDRMTVARLDPRPVDEKPAAGTAGVEDRR